LAFIEPTEDYGKPELKAKGEELQDSSENCSLNLKWKEKDQLQLQKVAESEKQQQLRGRVYNW
jgi:hypothetical protein